MSIPIQLQEQTITLLNSVKTKEKLANHDEVIRHLVQNHVDTAIMFGITKERPLQFQKEDELALHEL